MGLKNIAVAVSQEEGSAEALEKNLQNTEEAEKAYPAKKE